MVERVSPFKRIVNVHWNTDTYTHICFEVDLVNMNWTEFGPFSCAPPVPPGTEMGSPNDIIAASYASSVTYYYSLPGAGYAKRESDGQWVINNGIQVTGLTAIQSTGLQAWIALGLGPTLFGPSHPPFFTGRFTPVGDGGGINLPNSPNTFNSSTTLTSEFVNPSSPSGPELCLPIDEEGIVGQLGHGFPSAFTTGLGISSNVLSGLTVRFQNKLWNIAGLRTIDRSRTVPVLDQETFDMPNAALVLCTPTG